VSALLTHGRVRLEDRISAAREERLLAAFDFFDLDSNGVLTESEFMGIGKARGASPASQQVTPALDR